MKAILRSIRRRHPATGQSRAKFICAIASLCALVLLVFPSCSKPQPPNPEKADMEALGKLSKNFASNAGNTVDQLPYMDPVSLEKYVRAHKQLLNRWDLYGKEGMIERHFTFSQNLAATLYQKTPETYFASFTEKTRVGLPDNMANAEIAAISIDKNRPYVIFEIPPEKNSGLSRPDYIVQPAVKTPNGWRMDVSSTCVRNCEVAAALFD